MQKKQAKRKKRTHKTYPINQCSLFKLGSIKSLAKVLGLEKKDIIFILKNPLNYQEFTLKETYNHFSSKSIKARQVQTPFGDLRKIHERILYLLEPVVLPNYAHAAVKKRSYRTNAAAHINSKNIATFDLENFYGSTQRTLVYSFFLESLKCAPDVANALTNLTTFRNSMPTGSPLSPLLSLHAAKPMFDKIERLASSFDLTFTCYIDDLTLSGQVIPLSLERHISSIVNLYGYQLSRHKTKIFRKNSQKHVTGIVINQGKLSVPHSRFLTARNLESAIAGNFSAHGNSTLKLHEKLAGLLGETAYIDPSYKGWAKKAQLDLRAVRNIKRPSKKPSQPT
jgi:RNA-directed DNA polymerase